MASEEQQWAAVQRLAGRTGIGRVAEIVPLVGGRNNRAYRIIAGGRPFFLKLYPPPWQDLRPRLRNEQAFLTLAWNAGIRAVPEPIAADEKAGIALFGYVEGRTLRPGEVTAAHVDQALGFLGQLNDHRQSPLATALAAASEACFAFADHLRLVDRRVGALSGLRRESAVCRDAARFVSSHVIPLWRRIADCAQRQAVATGVAEEAPLPVAQRCLSPSDFGFHNAILQPSGRLVFCDFEYAGWDDPAKLIADFFYQPQVPVPLLYRRSFERRLGSILRLPARHAVRAAILAPVFGMKWVCIALNDFLPAGERRHRFTRTDADTNEILHTQLQQARRFVARLEEELDSSASAPLVPGESGRGE